ncbi:hypothetical protein ACFFK0_21015 [Paenibacillus chartarius]|uniref:Uncharacterized protein n=1 Tax=Paenibacillus chartarius TaxID=747481 RepID=A0ABV6DQP8_9BACL
MTKRGLEPAPRDQTVPEAEEDTYLPPRKTVHPSERLKWTRRFYLTLIWMLVLLTAALFVWGFKVDA